MAITPSDFTLVWGEMYWQTEGRARSYHLVLARREREFPQIERIKHETAVEKAAKLIAPMFTIWQINSKTLFEQLYTCMQAGLWNSIRIICVQQRFFLNELKLHQKGRFSLFTLSFSSPRLSSERGIKVQFKCSRCRGYVMQMKSTWCDVGGTCAQS